MSWLPKPRTRPRTNVVLPPPKSDRSSITSSPIAPLPGHLPEADAPAALGRLVCCLLWYSVPVPICIVPSVPRRRLALRSSATGSCSLVLRRLPSSSPSLSVSSELVETVCQIIAVLICCICYCQSPDSGKYQGVKIPRSCGRC